MATGSTCATDYVENRIINSFLRGYNLLSACPLYIGLFTSASVSGSSYESGSPWEVGYEVAGLGYTRMSASGADQYSSVSGGGPIPPIPTPKWLVGGGSAANLYEIDFPAAAGTWATIYGIGLASGSWRGASGSRLHFYSNPEVIHTVTTSDILSLPAYGMRVFFNDVYSAYLGNALFNWMLNSQSINQPGTSVYLGLFTNMPDIYGNNGNEVPKYWWNPDPGASPTETEPTGYVRKYIAGTSYWTEPITGSTVGLNQLINSLVWEATGDWGIIEGFVIFESVHNYILFKGLLDKPRQVLKGDTFRIGSFKVFIG